MNLLHAGVDTTVIALWLGHESPTTTRVYLHADMAFKEQAVATAPPDTSPARYQADDNLLTFFDQLWLGHRHYRLCRARHRTPAEPNGVSAGRGITAGSS